jgi:hypothetical protein
VQIEESFHQLPVDQNPYFIAKQSFLAHQIPVQEFEIETAQKPDKDLQFSLNNMALATYAKLNGIPCVANPTIAHELVIGLGSASTPKAVATVNVRRNNHGFSGDETLSPHQRVAGRYMVNPSGLSGCVRKLFQSPAGHES